MLIDWNIRYYSVHDSIKLVSLPKILLTQEISGFKTEPNMMIYICNSIVLWKVIDLYWNIRYYSIENSIILVYEEMGFPLWIVYDL